MAYTSYGSAIDDSFETNFFAAPSSSAPGGASTYDGPRAGHWAVNSDFGSAIDDRCPTVWNEDYYVAGRPGEGEPDRAIGVDLLKRLELATIEEEKKKPVAQISSAGSVHTAASSATAKESKPRGFYVPASVGGRALRQPIKPIKHEQPPPAAVAKKEKKQKQDTKVPELAIKPAPASIAQSKSQGIRITSKDGREAFVPLPHQPYVTSAPPTASISNSQKRHDDNKEQAQASREAQGTKNNGKPQQNEQPQTSKKQQKKKNKQAKQAKQEPAPAVKPVSEPKDDWNAPVIVESRKSSIEDSAISFGNFFDDAPASKQPSRAPSAALPAKSLFSAVRSISEHSMNGGKQQGAWSNSPVEQAQDDSAWPRGSVTRKVSPATPSHTVPADALRRAVAGTSQHNRVSDNGWVGDSDRAGSDRHESEGWGHAMAPPQHFPANSWSSVEPVRRQMRRSFSGVGGGGGWETPSAAARRPEYRADIWSEPFTPMARGEKSSIWRKDRLDHFCQADLDAFCRASSRPRSVASSGRVSLQTIRDRVKTISENSKRSGGEYAAAPIQSATRLQIEERSTRSFSVPTEIWDHERNARSAGSRDSRVNESLRSAEPAEDGWDQPMLPSYNGFREIGAGVINARFEPKLDSSAGIRERGEGWTYPRPEMDFNAKQRSSEPPRKHFYGNRPSSGAASERIPRRTPVYAGVGWIEGHPLSEAPAPYQKPIDAQIELPEAAYRKLPAEYRGKKDLSFEEWREVQQSTFQAEGTVVSSIRTERAPPSVASDSVYSSVRRYTAENKPPSVARSLASTKKSGHSGQWSEKDGEVHLNMPWDV